MSTSLPVSETEWITFISKVEQWFVADGSAHTNHAVVPSLYSIVKRAMFRYPELAHYTDFLPYEEQQPFLKEAAMQKRITETNYPAYMILCDEIDFAQAGLRFSPHWLDNWPTYEHIWYVISPFNAISRHRASSNAIVTRKQEFKFDARRSHPHLEPALPLQLP